MKTDEIIRQIEENGGLDMRYIRRASSNDHVSVRKYLTDMVRANNSFRRREQTWVET